MENLELKTDISPLLKEKVIKGLKFIAENSDYWDIYPVIKRSLSDLGLNYSLEEMKEKFPSNELLFEGIEKGDILSGLSLLISCKKSAIEFAYVLDRFFCFDDNQSIYHFIRKVTGDKTYTKEKIDSMKKETTLIRQKNSI